MIICAEYPENDRDKDKRIEELETEVAEFAEMASKALLNVFDLLEKNEKLEAENEVLAKQLMKYTETYYPNSIK
jgi:cell division septum initiation protein DivIVA